AGSCGWREPITSHNWRRLDGMIREHADDRAWHHGILDRLHIRRTGTEIARRENGVDDDRLQYALEWGFFTRCQWGEYDTALYELERCWGRKPESPSPIGSGGRPTTARTIRSLSDVHAAVEHYVDSIPYRQLISTATHISRDNCASRRDHGTPSEAALPMLPRQPPRQSKPLHSGAGASQLQSRRILVAQLFP